MSSKKSKTNWIEQKWTLRNITKESVTYRIEHLRGPELPISHIQVHRDHFPDDPDFNLAFINSEIPDTEANKAIIEKQKKFRKFLKFSMTVS